MLYHHLNHLPCVAEAQIEEKGEKNERTKDEEASAMRGPLYFHYAQQFSY